MTSPTVIAVNADLYSQSPEDVEKSTPRFASLARAGNLPDTIAQQLRKTILAGGLAPGSKLPPEQVLASEFGVSRNVVREAIARLKLSGYVQTRHGVGSFVASDAGQRSFEIASGEILGIPQLKQIYQLRIEVESGAAALAAEQRTDEQIVALRQSLIRGDQAGHDWKQGTETALDFHMLISEATNNLHFSRLLTHMRYVIRDAMQSMRLRSVGSDRIVEVAQEHRVVFEALLQKNSDGARQAMRTHLTNGFEHYKKKFNQESL